MGYVSSMVLVPRIIMYQVPGIVNSTEMHLKRQISYKIIDSSESLLFLLSSLSVFMVPFSLPVMCLYFQKGPNLASLLGENTKYRYGIDQGQTLSAFCFGNKFGIRKVLSFVP